MQMIKNFAPANIVLSFCYQGFTGGFTGLNVS